MAPDKPKDTSDIANHGPGTSARKLVIASNRLPVSLRPTAKGYECYPSSGGLVSAVDGLKHEQPFLWIGWPGSKVATAEKESVREMLAENQLVPVYLSKEQERHYYRGFCNQSLWPLFHYSTDKVEFASSSWDRYVEVNRLFADTILKECDTAAQVWVHDFHLMLVPQMLRETRPDLEIGFFLHIPFPSSEIYRLLPTRKELLEGILGADYVGFQTNDYARHFRSTCLRILGLESRPDSVIFEGRKIGIGVDPIGIDTESFRAKLAAPETANLLEELSCRYGERRLIIGIERLDYTKGIPHKLRAFERFLERDPERAKHVTLLQVLVPSRMSHPDYRLLKRDIEEFVGRLNGKYGGPAVTPVEYLYRSITSEQLIALYRFADACLVTPVRDGMNLVAQEFALCQGAEGPGPQGKGALVLSEFAGAAHHLTRALLVNPWDTDQTADTLETALALGESEKRERMAMMAQRVLDMDCRLWAKTYLDRLGSMARGNHLRMQECRLGKEETEHAIAQFTESNRRVVILDYDGTLREFTRIPDDATPTPEILTLLTNLGNLPDTEVHLASGRRRHQLDVWFGHLPIHICAEHGYAMKPQGQDWIVRHNTNLSWLPQMCTRLTNLAKEVPGSHVEIKNCSVAWHYRMADPDYGEWRARELLSSLGEELSHLPAEALSGHRVIEIRASGISKGLYVNEVVQAAGDDESTFYLCVGDDRTDHDMYTELPFHAIRIHVGDYVENIDHTLESPERVRTLLTQLIESGQLSLS